VYLVVISFFTLDFVWEEIFLPGLPEIHEYERPADVLCEAYESPLSWEHNPGPLGPDGLNGSNFFSRFHVFLLTRLLLRRPVHGRQVSRSVFMGSEDCFPAKRQECKVKWSAPDTEPDWIHCSSFCAGDPASGHSPACVPAIGADEDHFEYSLCFHLRNGEKAGRGRVKEDKTLPLALGEGPHFESARGLLGGTWRLRAG